MQTVFFDTFMLLFPQYFFSTLDIAMLIEQGLPDGESVKKALELTFRHREDHGVPFRLLSPPAIWEEPYQKTAKEYEVSKKTMHDAFSFVAEYWNSLCPDKPMGELLQNPV